MDPLGQETIALRARYDEEPSHSDQVAKLALELFDHLQGWHGAPARARELLHSAALLHDIGWSQTPDGKGHHKQSARLIREHKWKHLLADEVELVAQVARYHRKAPPLPDHEEFQALKAAAQKTVMLLGGVLRLADALDRTHNGRIAGIVRVEVAKEAITVYVKPNGIWNAERAMFEAKADMLQLAAKRAVQVEAQGPPPA
jgi:exopolyphosphatase/guanosine-5'-triphosphate,3'-diphosphate pyrophosphatase